MASQDRSKFLPHADPAAFPDSSYVLGDLLAERFTCRAYRPEPVEEAVIGRMLELAQMSASWCNTQPWNVIVTQGEATERFRAALFAEASSDGHEGQPGIDYPRSFPGVHGERRREVGWQLYDSVGVRKGDRAASREQALENFRLFGAPHVALICCERELGAYGAIDCGVYLGTLLLAAQSLGLGMTPQAALAEHSALIRRHFAVPDNLMFVVGASFGHADQDHAANSFRSRRAPVGENARLVKA
ncbi:nitroreductase [Sphingobium cloacae]|uniref:Nitroreductase n=1 Tax=Sphingobium cloacae TaxID=120107 RepID=A0A1E1F2F5_9SPHN|nr:nitroreductase [Sphingobium cloacae]BAV64703.1 nitroreductase [Sphingobium cloacae]